jgi:hypothetical protein
MTTAQTVATTTDTGAATYAAVAAELRRMADDLDTIGDQAAPGFVAFDMQPGGYLADAPTTMAAVDTVANALLGRTGELQRMSDSSYHYKVYGRRGPIKVDLYNRVPDPQIAELDAELERLRAQVAELQAASQPTEPKSADPDHGRTTAVAEARPDTLLQPLGRTAQNGGRS